MLSDVYETPILLAMASPIMEFRPVMVTWYPFFLRKLAIHFPSPRVPPITAICIELSIAGEGYIIYPSSKNTNLDAIYHTSG
jgi:hypothetical protein